MVEARRMFGGLRCSRMAAEEVGEGRRLGRMGKAGRVEEGRIAEEGSQAKMAAVGMTALLKKSEWSY